eukprot:TRINITY_DN68086_c1_g4_i1.p1 TRINITY_DN68086_c1_g4~~TRINITY_DN68086_c1_g4_i1.p1  ORF type:complete len:1312 (-),score=225.69 TRINITY_DN68086_c1_g4_i1:150-4085(-)
MSTVTVWINEEKYTVEKPAPTLSLNDFIRYQTRFKGTKRNCAEGGCGCCGVALTFMNGTDTVTRTINSCLRPLAACNGMHITTIDGIGSAKMGYNPLQTALATHNGTQCGYCSPGMVMTMYGLLQTNNHPTAAEIEKQYDGNLCRCTGYRPILAAMKTFASDYKEHEMKRVSENPIPKHVKGAEDLEEIPQDGVKDHSKMTKILDSIKKPTLPAEAMSTGTLSYTSENKIWVECPTLSYVQAMMRNYQYNTIYYVAGHTGWGVEKYYPHSEAQVFLNIGKIPELHVQDVTGVGITVGAGVPIVDVMNLLKSAKAPVPQSYMMLIAHLERVAHTMVRNIGTMGGNMMLCHKHSSTPENSFPSDVTTVLYGIGATVNIISKTGQFTSNMPIGQWLQYDMTGHLLVDIKIPFPEANEVFRSYKTAIRHVNSHAYVPTAMKAVVDPSTHKIVGQPTLVFGGIRNGLTRMTNTEKAMTGMLVTDQAAFHKLCATLEGELQPTATTKVAYRKQLAVSYLYKFFLALQPTLPANLKSAPAPWMTRGVSVGTQNYTPHPNEAPVGEYMVKLAAKAQTSGEAQYTDDIPAPQGCLHAAFVMSKKANADIVEIDATYAKTLPGVKHFFSASDISPMKNQWLSEGGDVRELFASKQVGFVGQPVGMILAESQDQADRAAQQVNVAFANEKPGVYDIDDAIKYKSFWPDMISKAAGWPINRGNASGALKTAPHTVKGTVECGSQYHFYMEPQTCLAVPDAEGRLKLHAATQYLTAVQNQVSAMLGVKSSDITVETRRLGGGYGGKIVNSIYPSAGAAFAAWKTGVPVKLTFDMWENMEVVGGRHPVRTDYEVGFDSNGKLQAVKLMQYVNSGYGFAEGVVVAGALIINTDGCYSCPNWEIDGKLVRTNIAPNTSARAPGWLPATFCIEHIMNHVATSLGKSPEEVKALNFYSKGMVSPTGDKVVNFNIPTLWSQLKQSSGYTDRITAVNTYNQNNKWRKKGLSMVPVKFRVDYGTDFASLIDVYMDGSVNITQGGVEMGQGLFTKVAQVVAKTLGCPMELITVQLNTTLVSNHKEEVTGGSIGSELSCYSAMQAANQIVEQLKAVKAALKMKDPTDTNPGWIKLATTAANMGVKLSGSGQTYGNTPKPAAGTAEYNSYSAALAEIEVDVLTGETEINRIDLLFDSGYSLNPAIDIGQIEGGFLMGVGYMLNEEHNYNKMTGQLMNLGTWEYKPPSAMDIPLVWNVSLLKNSPNPVGLFSSKLCGEPPLCSSTSVLFAAEQAVTASLMERGKATADTYYAMNGPATVDKIALRAELDYSEFNLA